MTANKEKEDAIAFVEVFFIRSGNVIGREHYKIENTKDSTESEIITDFIKQFYVECDFIPNEILTEYEPLESDLISDWLRQLKNRKVSLLTPKRGEKSKLVAMVKLNAEKALSNYKINQLKIKENSGVLELLKNTLGLDKIPARIEAYDISNISGSNNVAAMAVFEYGRPAKRKYRQFRIKSVEGADDYASMSEVVHRRYSRAIAEGTPLPDLIIADGGKGQMEVIRQVIEDELHLNIPIAGLAKDNRHRTSELLYGFPQKTIGIEMNSPLLKFLTRIQDEVHRYAITFHRDKRSKRQIASELDSIKGIGPATKTLLLREFKSVKRIKEAPAEAIAKVIGPAKTKVLLEALLNA